MSDSGHNSDRDEHFDEVDAVRRFPSEDEWLDLPLPEDTLPAADASPSFVDGVMQARAEERELDAEIARLDEQLPSSVLENFTAPEPSASFVDKAVNALQQDRRHRWQSLLARYVAPEPSPEFVERTLAALEPDAQEASSHQGYVADLSTKAPSRLMRVLPVVLAAAAIVLLTLQLALDEIKKPLELRLAHQAPPTVAYATSTTPLSAVFARVASDDEPYSMFDAPVDGLWLASATEDTR